MASGRDHDRATLLGCLPFGLALWPLLGAKAAVLGAAAFVVGGLWLSPDLDTRSRPLRRWGPLRWIWWPYRQLIPHRSLFSHGPLIGMALRLLWLLGVIALAWVALSPWPILQLPPAHVLSHQLLEQARQHPQGVVAAALGLEGSVWLHLLLDGDPLPAEWHHRRQGQQRSRRAGQARSRRRQ